MAGGFLLLAGLSRILFAKSRCGTWPLWPAAGLGFAGLMSLAGPDARQWFRALQPFWPYILIAVALFLFLSKPKRQG